MSDKFRCAAEGCGQAVLNRWLTALIAWPVVTGVLLVPFFNAVQADVKNIASLAGVSNISVGAVLIGIAWLIAGITATHEKHESVIYCVLHASGVPGLVILLISVLQS